MAITRAGGAHGWVLLALAGLVLGCTPAWADEPWTPGVCGIASAVRRGAAVELFFEQGRHGAFPGTLVRANGAATSINQGEMTKDGGVRLVNRRDQVVLRSGDRLGLYEMHSACTIEVVHTAHSFGLEMKLGMCMEGVPCEHDTYFMPVGDQP